MPMSFTFKCRKCDHEFVKYRSAENIRKARLVCPSCGKQTARRIFTTPQVIGDQFANPLEMTTLLPVYSDNVRVHETVSSRSELKSHIEKYNRKYGTELQHAG